MRILATGLACLALFSLAVLAVADAGVPAPVSASADEPGGPGEAGSMVSSVPGGDGVASAEAAAEAAAVTEAPTVAPVAARNAETAPLPPTTAAAPPRTVGAALPPFTSGVAALVLDDASAGILYAKDAHRRVQPASLTKIATAIVAVEHGDLDRTVTVDVDSRAFYDSTLMGLLPGDRFTVRDLLYGLMLPSGNDAAVALGRAVSGSDAAFVEAMNDLVARLGLQDTHFSNPHGLEEPGHYSSAYDMAMLSRYGMTLPDFRAVVQAVDYTAHGSRTIPMGSLISGLLQWVPGATGVKSGFTDNAGRTLVLSVERDGRRLYAVVMNDEHREADGYALIEWGFGNHQWTAPTATVAHPAPPAEPAADDVIRAAREQP